MRQKTDILSIMEGAARWHAGPVEACLCREPAADQGDADPGPIECEGEGGEEPVTVEHWWEFIEITPADDEPVLFEHGPDPHADDEDDQEDPFAELQTAAELAADQEQAAAAKVKEQDPDLRQIILLSYDSRVMVAMALGASGEALDAYVGQGEKLRQATDRLRTRLATRQGGEDMDDAKEKSAVAAAVRHVLSSLTSEALELSNLSQGLERMAVEAGNGYRRAQSTFREMVDMLGATWLRLNLTVLMHQAAKQDVVACSALRSTYVQLAAERAEFTAKDAERLKAEDFVHDMHGRWLQYRNRAQAVRRSLLNVRAAVELFGLEPAAFEATIQAADAACRRALEEMDAHKSLVVLEPPNLPHSVRQTLAQFPELEQLIAEMDRVSDHDLADLMLIAFALLRSPRSRGRTPKTVAKMLVIGKLIKEEDAPRAEEAIRVHHADKFNKIHWRRHWIWEMTDRGFALAQELFGKRPDQMEITAGVDEGRKAVNEEQRATKKRLAQLADQKKNAP